RLALEASSRKLRNAANGVRNSCRICWMVSWRSVRACTQGSPSALPGQGSQKSDVEGAGRRSWLIGDNIALNRAKGLVVLKIPFDRQIHLPQGVDGLRRRVLPHAPVGRLQQPLGDPVQRPRVGLGEELAGVRVERVG